MTPRTAATTFHPMHEGVIKYRFDQVGGEAARASDLRDLLTWRAELVTRRLIGVDDDGYGYGNLSLRLFTSPRFLITGSQTSGLADVDHRHFAEVVVVDLDRNYLTWSGATQPSSEALTHAALYQVDPAIHAVVHVHAPEIWRRLWRVLPTTRDDVAYGTPAMAHEMIRLYRRLPPGAAGVIVMGGHPDGMIAYGPTMAQAAGAILALA